MLEKLREALADCEAEKAVLDSIDYEAEIAAEVAAAEAAIRSKYSDRKTEAATDIMYQIKALSRLIDKEQQKANAMFQ